MRHVKGKDGSDIIGGNTTTRTGAINVLPNHIKGNLGGLKRLKAIITQPFKSL